MKQAEILSSDENVTMVMVLQSYVYIKTEPSLHFFHMPCKIVQFLDVDYILTKL